MPTENCLGAPGAKHVVSATWNLSAGELCAGGAREQPQIPMAVRQEVLHHYGMEHVPETRASLLPDRNTDEDSREP